MNFTRIFALFCVLMCFAFFSQNVFASNSSNKNLDCNNPLSKDYTTAECAEIRLGLSEINAGTFILPRDPNSVIVVVFRILISIATLAAVARGVLISIQIQGTGSDSEKRKELFTHLIYSFIALVVGLSSLGLTFLVQNMFFGRTFNDQVFKCSDLPSNAPQDLKEKCKNYILTTSTPAPGAGGGGNPAGMR